MNLVGNMTEVTAGIEYKINIDGKGYLLDERKFNLLKNIKNTGSITKAAKLTKNLDIALVNTSKGGSGGGGSATLTEEGEAILKECKKINAIMKLHRDVNEIEGTVVEVNKNRSLMKIQMNNTIITLPVKEEYEVGDTIIGLISYDNIIVMLKPKETSIGNILKGKIVEMKLINEMIRLVVEVDGINICADVTLSSSKDLKLSIGKPIYIGFKALSIATLKL